MTSQETKNATRPLVTVCIATCNRMALLPRAIDSVISQTYANLDIVIVDDGSGDGTPEVVSEQMARDARIRCIRHETNKGLAAARNAAIFSARGKYFAFLDDDDAWEPMFVEAFVELAERHDPNHVLCCGSLDIRRRGARIRVIPDINGALIDCILAGHVPSPSAQFYTTEELRKVGGYNEEIKSGVDHDLWLTLAFNGFKVVSLKESLVTVCPHAHEAGPRMTTDWVTRREAIQQSLEIWKPAIVNCMGPEFFEHFQMCYEYYHHRSFFTRSLKGGEIRKAWRFFWGCARKRALLVEVGRNLWRTIGRRLRPGRNTTLTVVQEPHFFPFSPSTMRNNVVENTSEGDSTV